MEINNPLSLPEDYLKVIGSATATLSTYEFLLEQLIWKLLKLDITTGYGESLTTHMGFRQKIHVIGTLCEQKHKNSDISQDNYTIAKKLLSKANEISVERNKIIHGIWGIDSDTGATFLINLSAYGKFNFQLKYSNIEDLNNFIGDVNKEREKLVVFTNSI